MGTQAAKGKSTWRASGRRRGFTLTELLVVIAIIGILLAATAAVVGTGEGSRSRKGARAELLGLLTRARAEAITRGEPVAVVLVGTEAGPDAMRGKAAAIFEVDRSSAAETWRAGEQIQRWVRFPGSAVLLDDRFAPRGNRYGVNAMAQEAILSVPVFERDRGTYHVGAPFVVFASTGSVVHPPGSGRIEFFVGEGELAGWHLCAHRSHQAG